MNNTLIIRQRQIMQAIQYYSNKDQFHARHHQPKDQYNKTCDLQQTHNWDPYLEKQQDSWIMMTNKHLNSSISICINLIEVYLSYNSLITRVWPSLAVIIQFTRGIIGEHILNRINLTVKRQIKETTINYHHLGNCKIGYNGFSSEQYQITRLYIPSPKLLLPQMLETPRHMGSRKLIKQKFKLKY